MVTGLAGCAEQDGDPPAAALPTPTAVVSSAAPVDPGRAACEAVQTIKDKGYRAGFGDVARAGDLGRKSPDRDISMKAAVMGDFAHAAAVSVQVGGDPREKGAQVRGLLDELISICQEKGYLPAPKRS